MALSPHELFGAGKGKALGSAVGIAGSDDGNGSPEGNPVGIGKVGMPGVDPVLPASTGRVVPVGAPVTVGAVVTVPLGTATTAASTVGAANVEVVVGSGGKGIGSSFFEQANTPNSGNHHA